MTDTNLQSSPQTSQTLSSGLRAMTVTQLFVLIESETASTIDSYRAIAEAICELDSRGADLSRLRSNPLFGALRKVGHRQLSLNAIASLPFNVLKHVERLPLPLQEHVSRPDAELVVVALKEDGQVYRWMRRPSELTSAEAKRVFAKDRIRDEEEQIKMLRMLPTDRRRATQLKAGTVALDFKRGGITVAVGSELVFIGEVELLESLAKLRKR